MISSAKLSIVGTPLGNIDDISLRAVEALCLADIIACEDTRRTKQLLTILKASGVWANILKQKGLSWPKDQRLISNFIGNEHYRVTELIAALEQGHRIALVSDSGMPALSDPGNVLIKTAIQRNCLVEIVPSATAYSSAVIRAGLGDRRHLFLGFIPKYSLIKFEVLFGIWRSYWETDQELLMVLYESPHRIKKTLKYLQFLENKYGLRLDISIVRELTKKHEEVVRGTTLQVIESIVSKGEMVLMIGLEANNLV